MPESPETAITFDVLRVASRDVLGATKPLSVATPCRFSNAKGNLREVDSFKDVSATAERSAADFLSAVKSERERIS